MAIRQSFAPPKNCAIRYILDELIYTYIPTFKYMQHMNKFTALLQLLLLLYMSTILDFMNIRTHNYVLYTHNM